MRRRARADERGAASDANRAAMVLPDGMPSVKSGVIRLYAGLTGRSVARPDLIDRAWRAMGQVEQQSLEHYVRTREAGTEEFLAAADMFDQLDLAHVWGDVSKVGIDGSEYDTWEDNLLAESHIRYGGFGGIAMGHISDIHAALFSHFIPCGG
ncbi:Tn3 family transposase [Micromonospora sp. NPDC047670]|uniref:Tn3 family transposase n=1 Tax=Micromonospora sp. NPDC047670 TaxID=3364252 RepID=UPI003711E7F0